MWKSKLSLLIVVFLFVVAFPAVSIWRQQCLSIGSLGTVNEHQLRYATVDRCFNDRFRCLVYDAAFPGQVYAMDEQIVAGGQVVDFPEGKNLAWLAADGKFAFDSIGPEDVVGGDGKSEAYWIFGRFPKFKDYPECGRPSDEFINVNAPEQFTGIAGGEAVKSGGELLCMCDDMRILGFWQSPDINGHPDNPMWMVHEYRRDGTVAIWTVWIEEAQAQQLAEDTLDFALLAGRLSLGKRDQTGKLQTDDQHWWEQPIRLADGEFRYDDSEGGEISWKKIASVEAIDRDRR